MPSPLLTNTACFILLSLYIERELILKTETGPIPHDFKLEISVLFYLLVLPHYFPPQIIWFGFGFPPPCLFPQFQSALERRIYVSKRQSLEEYIKSLKYFLKIGEVIDSICCSLQINVK